MPDGRFLSKSIAYSDQVGRVSLEADYLFMRMIPHLDREGRILGSPKALKAMCCPLRDELTPKVIERALGELAAVKLIVWYEVDGVKYCAFPGFDNHQRGARLAREAASRLPAPENAAECGGDNGASLPHDAGVTADQVRSNGGVSPELLPLSKEKRSEVKRSKGAPDGATDTFPIPVYDWLHRAWTRLFGVIEVPQFRRGVKQLLTTGLRPGQIARGFAAYRDERNAAGKDAKFAWFLEDAQKHIADADSTSIEQVPEALRTSVFGMSEQEIQTVISDARRQLAIFDEGVLRDVLQGLDPPAERQSEGVPA